MDLIILSVFLNILVINGTIMLWYVYHKQYRFATILNDMLPFYPYFIGILLIISIVSSTYLIIKGYLIFIFLLLLLITNTVIQGFYFINWYKNYQFHEYSKLLEKLNNNSKIKIISYDSWLDHPVKDPDHILVLIRHDVDISLVRAKRMFDEEKKYSTPSCYFIRNNAERYKFSESTVLLDEVVKADDFSIGFHYETIKNANGDLTKAKTLFTQEIQDLRQNYPIRIIAAHGDKFLNRRLVTENIVNLDPLKLKSSYDLPHDFYISDAGGKHHFKGENNNKVTLKDKLKILDEGKPGILVQILIHPDWWY